MHETDRAAVLAWAAGQLTWERRLRELEAATAVEEAPATQPADPDIRPAQASKPRRGAGRHVPAH